MGDLTWVPEVKQKIDFHLSRIIPAEHRLSGLIELKKFINLHIEETELLVEEKEEKHGKDAAVKS